MVKIQKKDFDIEKEVQLIKNQYSNFATLSQGKKYCDLSGL